MIPELPDHGPLNNKPRKTSRKNRTAEQRAKINERIEFVRGLLRLNFTTGDIKRMASDRWKIKRRAVEQYITAGRRRNRQILEVTEDQALADSLAYWSRLQQTAEQTIARRSADEEKALGELQQCSSEIAELEISPAGDTAAKERIEILELRRATLSRLLDRFAKSIYSARQDSQSCQDRIDRLKGNFAPVKIARTDAKGADIQPEKTAEPSTVGQAEQELAQLIESLKGRGAGPAARPSVN